MASDSEVAALKRLQVGSRNKEYGDGSELARRAG